LAKLARKVREENEDQLEKQELLAQKDPVDQKDLKAFLDLLVRQEILVIPVSVDLLEEVAPKE